MAHAGLASTVSFQPLGVVIYYWNRSITRENCCKKCSNNYVQHQKHHNITCSRNVLLLNIILQNTWKCSKDVFLHIKKTWFGFFTQLPALSSKQLSCLLPISDMLRSCTFKNSNQNTVFFIMINKIPERAQGMQFLVLSWKTIKEKRDKRKPLTITVTTVETFLTHNYFIFQTLSTHSSYWLNWLSFLARLSSASFQGNKARHRIKTITLKFHGLRIGGKFGKSSSNQQIIWNELQSANSNINA